MKISFHNEKLPVHWDAQNFLTLPFFRLARAQKSCCREVDFTRNAQPKTNTLEGIFRRSQIQFVLCLCYFLSCTQVARIARPLVFLLAASHLESEQNEGRRKEIWTGQIRQGDQKSGELTTACPKLGSGTYLFDRFFVDIWEHEQNFVWNKVDELFVSLTDNKLICGSNCNSQEIVSSARFHWKKQNDRVSVAEREEHKRKTPAWRGCCPLRNDFVCDYFAVDCQSVNWFFADTRAEIDIFREGSGGRPAQVDSSWRGNRGRIRLHRKFQVEFSPTRNWLNHQKWASTVCSGNLFDCLHTNPHQPQICGCLRCNRIRLGIPQSEAGWTPIPGSCCVCISCVCISGWNMTIGPSRADRLLRQTVMRRTRRIQWRKMRTKRTLKFKQWPCSVKQQLSAVLQTPEPTKCEFDANHELASFTLKFAVFFASERAAAWNPMDNGGLFTFVMTSPICSSAWSALSSRELKEKRSVQSPKCSVKPRNKQSAHGLNELFEYCRSMCIRQVWVMNLSVPDKGMLLFNR